MPASASTRSSSATRAPSASGRRDPALLALGAFTYFLALGLGIPTLPRYVTGPLGGSPAQVGVAVAVFSVTAILARPLVAPAARRVAPSVLLVVGAAMVGAATVATAGARSVGAVIALRALAGVGEALFYVLAASAVYAIVPRERHAQAQGRFSAVVAAGILVGPIVAEALRPRIGYAAIWVLGGGLCAAACACVARLPLDREPARDGGGAVLARGAVLPGLVVAAQTWAMAAFSVFVALYAAQLDLGSAGPPFAVVAVVVLSVRTVGAAVFDAAHPVAVASVAMAAATTGLALLAAAPSRAVLLVAAALVGVSQALAFPSLLALAVRRASSGDRTSAIATFTGCFEVGLASAAVVLGVVLDRLGFAGLYGVAAAVSALALVPLALAWSAEREAALADV
jgi:predicted MFS family arabinose efflux permease